ncbi:HAUS augmin-like complex subunit 5 [Actinia tenebrosa]|uniref:HAUS augmin-like complex subunit 5 n=1 Tax=Actinia tenebrosa TaxID=6105 RepID=A0A6P8HJZ5_ACTTE|nr:HAUS augmin-like complex subunit 5 [Actinia tenebrosa]
MSSLEENSRLSPRQEFDVCEELRKWAVEEMRFRPQGKHVNTSLPTSQDLKMLSRGSMVNVWEFVVKHVKSAQNAQKIRGNLKLQQLLHDNHAKKSKLSKPGEREELQSEFEKVTRELADIRGRVNHIQKEIKHLEKEILITEQAYSSAARDISDLQKRSSLLSAHSKQCTNIIQAYKELTTQLKNRLDNHRNLERKSAGETTYYTVQRDNTRSDLLSTPARLGDRSSASVLESSCTRTVREACESIGSYLKAICVSEVDQNEHPEAAQPASKAQLWSAIEVIINQNPSQDILLSLVVTTQDSATSLKELTEKINLKQDAEELKFEYEKGGKLTDTSQPPTLLQSVHQLIEEGQAQHFQRFLDAERAMNASWKARKELQALNHQMEDRLDSRYRGLPGSVELAKSLYHCELELAASKASLSYIKTAIQDLEQTRHERLLALETIQHKHNKIEDFEKLAKSKQSIIQALVKQNFAAMTRLEKQKLELLHYMQNKVCTHQAHVAAMAIRLQKAVSCDVDKFAAVPMTRLLHLSMESGQRIPMDDLSIYRLEDLQSRSGGEPIGQILDKLDFPSYKAPEELLSATVELRNLMEDTAVLVNSRQQDIIEQNETSSADRIVSHLNTLRHEVSQQDNHELNHVLPHVQDGLGKATKALSKCIAVKDSANVWWEQPAQYVVPWVKVSDMNTRQWLDQWTLNATRLRQLQMQH